MFLKNLIYLLGGLLEAQNNTVVLLVPLTEGSGVNLDDGVLHQGVGADQLVVAGVVDHTQDTGLAGNSCTKFLILTTSQDAFDQRWNIPSEPQL